LIFTYGVNGTSLLERIAVPLAPERFLLITGVEDRGFGLVGGIIAGLFPIEKQETVPQIEALMDLFTGDLEVFEPGIPGGSVYLGPDPERHFLFSRVREEIFAHTGGRGDPGAVLGMFSLGKAFLQRRISTLSGGEKMKVALSIAFCGAFALIVLHGVLPWLDRPGKEILLREIVKAKGRGGCVVVLEQEIDDLIADADKLFYYDGTKILAYRSGFRSAGMRRVDTSAGLVLAAGSAASRSSGPPAVVAFDSVRFQYESPKEGGRGKDVSGSDGSEGFSLRDVSFALDSGKVYGLHGDNGSGKSTIAKLILRAEKAAGGAVFFLGKDVSTAAREELVRGICYVGQFPEQQITMSCVEDYRMKARRMKNPLAEELLGAYFRSGGSLPISLLTPLQLKLLILADSAASSTQLIMLDEPTWGIDPAGQADLLEALARIIRTAVSQGRMPPAILVISHDMRFLRSLGAETFQVREGRVIKDPGANRKRATATGKRARERKG
jgi:energy-coupling factor transporter ATP-binding protein EcfA2